MAHAAGFQKNLRDAAPFSILTYTRAKGAASSLVVYIEGDGAAYRSRTLPSADPTPKDPVALRLAAADPAPAVAYIARPCQLTTGEDRRGCDPAYWTRARFAPEVVAALNRVLDAERDAASASRLHLVGFSGGGVLATLLAARRSDVASLTTVAAPLDLEAWTTHHDIDVLSGSLDPAVDVAAHREPITPQVHLVGARDEVVPRSILDAYRRSFRPTAPIRIEVVEGLGHRSGWPLDWDIRIEAVRQRLFPTKRCCEQ